MDPNNQWEYDASVVDAIFFQYFQDIFKAEEIFGVDEVVNAINPKISVDDALLLEKAFTEEEVIFALKQMHPLKAPGPDGIVAPFYSKFWQLIKACYSNILNGGASPQPINQTHITLIQKKKQSTLPKDFRLISLCNVAFKLVSKCIANRLKHLLPTIISHSQSAFVHGRLITNNALLAFEHFHAMKTPRSANQASFALKLDMSKVYDRVEWAFS